METHHFLAFDCGATSGRAMLGTLEGERFSMKEVYRFPNRILEIGGKSCWNVYAIYEHFLACLAQLGREGVRLDCAEPGFLICPHSPCWPPGPELRALQPPSSGRPVWLDSDPSLAAPLLAP